MPKVQFTSNLRRFHPKLAEIEIEAQTVSQLIDKINDEFPGIKDYLVDDQRSLRHHVNIFINDKMIKDRIELQDSVFKKDTIFIMQALSGG